MRYVNPSKSAVKRMREYKDKILLLHLFSLSTPDVSGAKMLGTPVPLLSARH